MTRAQRTDAERLLTPIGDSVFELRHSYQIPRPGRHDVASSIEIPRARVCVWSQGPEVPSWWSCNNASSSVCNSDVVLGRH